MSIQRENYQTGETSLSKGMVAIDEEQTEEMLLRRECRKVTWPTSALEEEALRFFLFWDYLGQTFCRMLVYDNLLSMFKV